MAEYIGAVKEQTPGKQRRRVWFLRVLLVVVLVFGLLAAVRFSLRPRHPPIHRIGESIPWNMDIGVDLDPLQKVFISYDLVRARAMPWARGTVVEARITEVLPDTYLRPSEALGGEGWRMLQMETRDVVIGKNMPDTFFLMLPDAFSVGLSRFDTFLMTISQTGMGEYTLINKDQCRYESFMPVFSAHSSSPDMGEIIAAAYNTGCGYSVLAFRNGFLDMSLWDGDTWDYSGAEKLLSQDEFPVKPGYSLARAKLAIGLYRLKYAKDLRPFNGVYFTAEDYPDPAAEPFIGGFSDFQNGTFLQISGCSNVRRWVQYQRLVNGFVTNERYSVSESGEITEADVVFTPEDIQALPDLAPVIQRTLAEAPEGITSTTTIAEVTAGYRKEGDILLGYVRVVWGDRNNQVAAKNLIVHTDNTIREMTEDQWKKFAAR